MQFISDHLRLSSPILSESKIYTKSSNQYDEEYLCNRLKTILLTLQSQKEEYQKKYAEQKNILSDQIISLNWRIIELQTNNQKLQQECRQTRFNYHQRGSVVDYLKKKITALEKKFDSQREEMVSVIKYLEGKNAQLNQQIFQFNQKQIELNEHIFALQQKIYNFSSQTCNKNIEESQKIFNNHKRITNQKRAQSHRTRGSFTPKTQLNKISNLQQPISSINMVNRKSENFLNIVKLNHFEDSQNQSFEQSSIRQKTVKFQKVLNKVKSDQEFNMQDNLRVNNKQSNLSQLHQISGKRILINNYGHLSFTDYPHELRVSGPKRMLVERVQAENQPKMSLPYKPRTFNDLLVHKNIRNY